MRRSESTLVSKGQRGFFLGYALATIFLLSLATAAAARWQSAQDSGARMVSARDALLEQSSLIRSKLLSCAAMYPTSSIPGAFSGFPADADSEVSGLTCPGAPAGFDSLWQNADALAAPTPPRGFSPWRYTRDASDVIRLTITQTDSSVANANALASAAKRMGASATIVSNTLLLRIN